jgi:hypothetical protein
MSVYRLKWKYRSGSNAEGWILEEPLMKKPQDFFTGDDVFAALEVPRSIEGFPRLRTPITHGVTSPAPASPAGSFCRRQPSGNRRHVLSEPVPTTRRSPPHDGRTKVVVS